MGRGRGLWLPRLVAVRDRLRTLRGKNLQDLSGTFTTRAAGFVRGGGPARVRALLARVTDPWLPRCLSSRRGRLALLAGVLAPVVLVTAYAIARPNAVLVEVEGRVLGVARSEAVVRQTVGKLEAEMAAQGWVRPENCRRLSVRPYRAGAEQVLGEDVLQARLRDSLAFNVQAVSITVNGRQVVWVKDRATAEQVVASAKKAFIPSTSDKVLKVALEEKVDFQAGEVKSSEVVTPAGAVQTLLDGAPRSRKYTVVEGDSFWSIAVAHGLAPEELQAANPQVKGELLQIGDELRLVKSEPFVHVVVTREVQVENTIPYSVELRKDSSLYRGQERVKQKGQPGVRAVTYRLVERNGAEIAREEVAKSVIKEPVPQIVAKGTKRVVVATASRSGSGDLSWPVSGRITSGYGYRGREFHSGIDIGAAYGEPVHAAAGGTVIYAGRNGGYGRTILIDHGNSVTRYAHLSSIKVEPGEEVSRGEVIGAVGESGRATGPHLHFEVLVNGNARSPLSYMR